MEMPNASMVSLVIPTAYFYRKVRGSEICLIHNCVESLIKSSSIDNIEIVVVEDMEIKPEAKFFDKFEFVRIKRIKCEGSFNFADKCNLGFLESSASYVVFLNDDVEAISPNWLETITEILQQPDVGICGPLLLFENGRIQSAGICNNPAPHNYGSGLSPEEFEETTSHFVTRNVAGVTGACLALRREVYTEVGGMSNQFPNNFNDIDLCFKVLQQGYRIVWTPDARLWHFESSSRDSTVTNDESQRIRSRWGRFFGKDPYTPTGTMQLSKNIASQSSI
jgi:GT2 family glycosyltransferase